MIATPMPTSYRFRANIRPIKYAYFVRDDDWDALKRVIRLVCTQWGGIRSLIIPVKSDLTLAPMMEYLLGLHEPDSFVDYVGDSGQRDLDRHKLLQAHIAKLWPHRAVQLQIGGRSFEEWDRTLHPLGAIPDTDKKHELVCHEFDGPQEDEPILLALSGAIYQGQQQDYEKTLTLCPTRLEVEGESFWASQFANSPFSSVLNLTSIGIRPRTVTGLGSGSNHFDVSVVGSLESVCMFWNNRATRDSIQFETDMGRRTLLLPMRLLDNQSALRSLVEFIRARLPYPNVSTNLHVRFNVWSNPDQCRLQAAIASIPGFQEFTERKISVQHHWSKDEPVGLEDLSDKPITYRSIFPELPQSYLEGINNRVGRDITLHEGANEIFVEPPPEYHNRFGGNVALDLECDVWKRFGKTQRTAEKIRTGSWFSRYGLTSVAEVGARPQYIDISIPSEKETLETFFEERGYQVRVSRPGQYASAVVNLVGGLAGIDIIASRLAYLLLETLALRSTLKLAQRIVQQLTKTGIPISADIAADIQPLLEDMEIIPELKRVPKTYRQLCSIAELQTHSKDLLACLARLSERQIIKRGFHLPCPNCGTPTWYPLATIEETVACPGCSWRFPLPVEYPVGSEIQWEYTLNTLVNRAMDQDALVSAIALRHLSTKRQASCPVPGLEILQANQVKAEMDFVFVSEQDVFAGECKAGNSLGDKDINTARLAADLGMKGFFFCTLSNFDDASKQLIQALRDELVAKKAGLSVEVLEGSALLGETIAENEGLTPGDYREPR